MTFETVEYDFVLPLGCVDENGLIHKQGRMRVATAADEMIPTRYPQVQDNLAYFDVVVLSRVVTKLGALEHIEMQVIERLFASDFSYLKDIYERINKRAMECCPKCLHKFDVDVKLPAALPADQPLKTEYEFTLPKGYLDNDGVRHKQGVMRLANVGDMILPKTDARVQQNPAYLIVLQLARTVTRLGTVEKINAHVMENFFSTDFNYLQDFFDRINKHVPAPVEATCPKCQHKFEVERKLSAND
ncbi:MAG: hypothetical protein WA056_06885 [Gallionella sp.]